MGRRGIRTGVAARGRLAAAPHEARNQAAPTRALRAGLHDPAAEQPGT